MMKKHAGYESATKWLVKNFMNVCICYRMNQEVELHVICSSSIFSSDTKSSVSLFKNHLTKTDDSFYAVLDIL